MKYNLEFGSTYNLRNLPLETPTMKKLQAIYNALNQLNNTWCYSEYFLRSCYESENEYQYVFTFSHQFYFFDVFADLDNNLIFFRDKLNFLYDEVEKLNVSEIFTINVETFIPHLQKFMADNKLKHIVESRGDRLNIDMIMEVANNLIEDLVWGDIRYMNDEEEMEEIFEYLQTGNNKTKFKLFDELIRVLIEGNYEHKITDAYDGLYLEIYYADNVLSFDFYRKDEDLVLLWVTFDKMNETQLQQFKQLL